MSLSPTQQNQTVSQSYLQVFRKAQQLFKQGYLQQSRLLYQGLLVSMNPSADQSLTPSLCYDVLLNLSTIQLQQNHIQQSMHSLRKAIHLNPQRYEALYNLSIASYYSNLPSHIPISCLKHCLSILYLQLGILSRNLKFLNKSITLYDKNPKAYIHRALFYQSTGKIKLAENQFEKLTFYDENDNGIQNEIEVQQFPLSMMKEIFAQKVLFFRRIKNTGKMQENLVLYQKQKRLLEEKNGQQNCLEEKLRLLMYDAERKGKNEQSKKQQRQQQKKSIIQLIGEVQDLITQIKEQKYKQVSESSTSKKEKDTIKIERLAENVSVPSQHQTSSKTSISNDQPPTQSTNQERNPLQKLQDENLLSSQIPNQYDSLPHNDQNPSISINDDEDSAILNQKIQQLQRQIKESGGNVPEIKDMSRNSEEENFLEFQIEKTIEEINKKKYEGQQKVNANELLPLGGRSSVFSQKLHSAADDNKDTLTLRSKISQTYELNLQEIKAYKSFQLQIRSVTMWDEKSAKKQAYTRVKYFKHKMMTQKCKNDKLTWNHSFEEILIKHNTLEDIEDQTKYQLHVDVHAKEGGWLSWHHDVQIGIGIIKLTQKGATKCTLENDGKKVGLLYYKIKLNKSQVQEKK